ncbi:nuclear transport factor 2 family protein [Marmoricola sp. URHB0036]|uniref:nuclear transport factor 2 family protein n=1 Tax=Marmoricola sp. URHB0036 TaxID=1298863 RepID=UPI0004845082|nr:nuclear transport factor 2 family protein [Marmoricola sp. URHB0036]
MEHTDVRGWVRMYESAWRSPGTDKLAGVFTEDVRYLASPWADPVEGLAAVAEFWDDERDGPDEEFTMSSEVVAVDGRTAVVRAQVDYVDTGERWRDLWVLRFADDGRCSHFEEWPIAPEQDDGH